MGVRSLESLANPGVFNSLWTVTPAPNLSTMGSQPISPPQTARRAPKSFLRRNRRKGGFGARSEYGVPYNTLSGEVRAAISDLAVLKYEVLKKVGDAVGNTQAYQL